MKYLSEIVCLLCFSLTAICHPIEPDRYRNCTDGRPNPGAYCSALENHIKLHIHKDVENILKNMKSYVSFLKIFLKKTFK